MSAIGFGSVLLAPFVLLFWLAVAIGLGWLLLRLLGLVGMGLVFLFRVVAWPFQHVFRFLHGTVTDALGLVGSALTAAFFVPLALVNFALGRQALAKHYGDALEREIVGIGGHVYRLVLGHPARLLCLTRLTEGVERRIPDVMARSPVETGRLDRFEGYAVVGTLPAGGSGARLYLGEPSATKLRQFTEAGHPAPDRVVIKSFSLEQGSTLPQIVRENRSLEAARRLGLVLEHQMSPNRFFYVMPYVPGADLTAVARRIHDRSGDAGLDHGALGESVGYVCDVLEALQRFHAAGLWHKDIKPANIIVSEGRAHLVDLGLMTPLQSSLTLTTHGTEYYRDPELVRLALEGVKVHEVNGVKFDVYGVGAVLFSLIENGFPAHGSLSHIKRRCPEALRWIVRRAMADLDRRYDSATAMLADLSVVRQAQDPFAVKPASLPSVSGAPVAADPRPAGAPALPAAPATRPRRRRMRRAGHVALAAVVGGVAMVGAWRHLGSRGMLPSPPGLLLLSAGNGGPSVSVSPGGRMVARSTYAAPELWHSAVPAPRTVAPAEQAVGTGRVILVLNDLPPGTSATVDRACSALDRLRYTLLGQGQPGADQERTIRLEAGARAAVGLGTPADADARQRLAHYLQSLADEELHAILWFARGDQAGTVHRALVARDQGDSRRLMSLLQARTTPQG